MDLETAIKILRKEYEKASKQKWIYNPVAYALYQAWKQANRGGKE